MKQLILLLFMLAASILGFANNPQNNGGNIIITPTTPPTSGTPNRNIVSPDIEATYSMGAITFVFNEDLGNCDIEVTNIDTGEVWYTSFAGVGSTIVYTSGSEGQYYIYIDTDSGAYTGEYNNY